MFRRSCERRNSSRLNEDDRSATRGHYYALNIQVLFLPEDIIELHEGRVAWDLRQTSTRQVERLRRFGCIIVTSRLRFRWRRCSSQKLDIDLDAGQLLTNSQITSRHEGAVLEFGIVVDLNFGLEPG